MKLFVGPKTAVFWDISHGSNNEGCFLLGNASSSYWSDKASPQRSKRPLTKLLMLDSRRVSVGAAVLPITDYEFILPFCHRQRDNSCRCTEICGTIGDGYDFYLSVIYD